MEARTIAGSLGAVVDGVDLEHIDDATFEDVQRALLVHQVLFFRGQDLSIAGQASFAGRFGELEVRPMTEKLDDDHPEVTLLHSERGGRADVWHTDFTYSREPMLGAVLRYIEGPQYGGDTMWASLSAAYDALSVPMKELLDGLTALHRALPGQRLETEAEHPVVVIHPVTGRRALFVNRLYTAQIAELHPLESRGVLDTLFDWVERPEFTCRWSWEVGDVAVWDNRCTMHYAIGDYSVARIAHRVAVLGTVPVGSPQRWPRHADGPASASQSLLLRRRT